MISWIREYARRVCFDELAYCYSSVNVSNQLDTRRAAFRVRTHEQVAFSISLPLSVCVHVCVKYVHRICETLGIERLTISRLNYALKSRAAPHNRSMCAFKLISYMFHARTSCRQRFRRTSGSLFERCVRGTYVHGNCPRSNDSATRYNIRTDNLSKWSCVFPQDYFRRGIISRGTFHPLRESFEQRASWML